MKKRLALVASTIPLMLLLLIYAGDTYHDALVSVSVFFALLTLLSAAALRGPKPSPLSLSGRLFATGPEAWWIRLSALTAGALLLLLLSDRPYQMMVIFPRQLDAFDIATGVAAALLALLLVKPLKPTYAVVALVAAGAVIRLCWFSQWEINPAKRDMLALVMSAIETLLDGHNPYRFHQMQVGSLVPLTYPPGLWLAHLPAFLLGIDIRWTAWVADAIIVLSLGLTAARARSQTFGPVMVGLAGYLFLPDIHWNAIYAEPHADWAVLALLTTAVLARRPYLSGALLGIALTMRPFNLVLVPFFGIWLVRRFGWRRAWRALLIAGAIAAALYVPFVLWDPDAFFAGTVRWLLAYGPAHRTWFFDKLSFSGPLYEARLDAWLPRCQLGAVILMFGLALWRLRTTAGLLLFWTWSYALFVAFNSIVWMSFWIGVCLLAMAYAGTLGVASRAAPAGAALPSGRKWLLLEVPASALLLVALSWMLCRLHGHFSEAGQGEARRFVKEQLAPDDLLIDTTAYRVAFLKTPTLLAKRQIVRGAQLAEDPFTALFPARVAIDPLRPKRVFAVTRYGLFENQRALYLGAAPGREGPFALKETTHFGRYTVHRLERRPGLTVLERLTGAVADLRVAVATPKKTYPGELRQSIWRFQGRPGRDRVERRECRIDRFSREMLYAAPPIDGATLIITAKTAERPKWVTLYGGITDRAAAWHRSDVSVVIRTEGGETIGRYTFPNLPGMFGASFAIPEKSGPVTFEVGAKGSENRPFCFDAVFSKE